jgi:hypothetical protein
VAGQILIERTKWSFEAAHGLLGFVYPQLRVASRHSHRMVKRRQMLQWNARNLQRRRGDHTRIIGGIVHGFTRLKQDQDWRDQVLLSRARTIYTSGKILSYG